jgi:hypothetical protein
LTFRLIIDFGKRFLTIPGIVYDVVYGVGIAPIDIASWIHPSVLDSGDGGVLPPTDNRC